MYSSGNSLYDEESTLYPKEGSTETSLLIPKDKTIVKIGSSEDYLKLLKYIIFATVSTTILIFFGIYEYKIPNLKVNMSQFQDNNIDSVQQNEQSILPTLTPTVNINLLESYGNSKLGNFQPENYGIYAFLSNIGEDFPRYKGLKYK